MNTTIKTIGIVFLILLGVLAFAEGIPNIIHNQYKEDCKEDELFSQQSFIRGVGYCYPNPEIEFCNKIKRC